MMKSSIITVTLITLCSWLGWTAYEEAERSVPSTNSRAPVVEAETTQGKGKSGPERTAIIFPPLETLGEIVSRPLFNVSRRPIAVEKSTPAEKQTDLNLMLSGIVIGQTQQIAHLRSATEKQTHALSVGDKIGNWQIQSIFPDRVVLQSGGRVETLFMQKPGAKKPVSGSPQTARAKAASRRAKARRAREKRRRSKRNND